MESENRQPESSSLSKTDDPETHISVDADSGFFNICPDLLCIVSGDGCFLHLNSAWENTLGVNIHELMRKPFTAFMHPDDNEPTAKVFARGVQGKNVFDFIGRFRCHDGSFKWLSWKAVFNEGAGDVYASVHDITESKRKLESLRKSEEMYRRLVENVGEGFGLMDDNEVFLFANPVAEKIFGVKEVTLAGRCLTDFLEEHTIEIIRNETRRRSYGISSTYEIEIVLPDKSRKDILVTASPSFEGLNFKGTLGVFRDISERKLAEKSIKEREQLFHDMFESHNVVKLLIDPVNGHIVDANSSAARFYGYPMELLKKMNINQIVAMPKDEILSILDNAVQRQHDYSNLRHKLSSGEIRNVDVHSCTFNHKGKKLLFAIIHDVTDRNKAQEALIESEASLRELNATKDKFFSIIAHDLRSPFNGLLGLIKLMEANFRNMTLEQIRNYLEAMGSSANNLFRLLENLLEWSRLQQGMVKVQPVSFLLKPHVNMSCELIQESAKSKDIHVLSEIPEDLVVYADERMVDSIVRNLCSNAVKFTPKTGTITLAARIINPGVVEISVRDTGIGMSREMLDNLFKIDVHTSHDGTEGEPSSGLGLILCKEFVEKNEGKIWVESEVGRGSSFYFTLPSGSEVIAAVADDPIQRVQKVKTDQKKCKTLIVDDDYASNIFLTQALKIQGHEVFQAKSGIEAIEIFHRTPDINLILMDLSMPGMNGFEATRQIRQLNKDVVIIVQTANLHRESEVKALDAGCNMYLAKPIDLDELNEILNQYINRG